jgi:Tetratricopeptide repeat
MFQIFTRPTVLACVGVVAALCAAGARADAATCSASQGQLFIDQGQYDKAVKEFTCVINAQPTEVEGYRGRIEAQLMLGRFSNAMRDYARVIAFVMPVHPDAETTILSGYSDRLAVAPDNIPALTGASFVHWISFEYAPAIHIINHLLDLQPSSVYGNLYRGSCRMLLGATVARGVADLETAIAIAPQSPDVRFIVSDAYTYGQPDPQRAFAEASLALAWGLDTPRAHAILATAYLAFGDFTAAAAEYERHIELVTTELVPTSPLAGGDAITVGLAPGRTFEIPIPAIAGQTLSIATSSPTHEIYDSIAVLISPNGMPAVGSDDYIKYFAGFQWVAAETGTYRLRVTSFESVNTGQLQVTRY